MKKSAEELLEEISDFLVVYLKSGEVRLNSFIEKTDLPISQMDQLLKIHFLLQEEVQAFVRELPSLIRNFKTTTKVEQDAQYGQVRGQIHWNKTINERLKVNYKDKTIFIVNERNREYAIKENLVLLETIRTIHVILYQDIDSGHLEKYSWFKEWGGLKNVINSLLQKNVYLSRVKQDQTVVTERMILDTIKHRNPLYKRAAVILQQYRKIISGEIDEQELRTLLRETFVQPNEEDVLFELYWVVKLIEQNTVDAELQLMDGRNNQVAAWQDEEYVYKLYHDSAGSTSIRFYITTDEVSGYEHPFINRQLKSMNEANAFAEQIFQRSFDMTKYWRGRPDILVEVFDLESGNLVKLVIGEVKYTTRVEYAITGLRELMDYTKLVKDKSGKYLEDEIEVNGILFTGNIDGQKHDLNQLQINEELKSLTWCAY